MYDIGIETHLCAITSMQLAPCLMLLKLLGLHPAVTKMLKFESLELLGLRPAVTKRLESLKLCIKIPSITLSSCLINAKDMPY